jgi:hypothetical protein
MVKQDQVAEAVEVKVPSNTDQFKMHLQSIYSEMLGNKVSKETAWKLFKATQEAPFNYMLGNWDKAGKPTFVKVKRMTAPEPGKGEAHEVEEWSKVPQLILSLAGVGKYQILPAGARGDKAETQAFTPRPRYYPSSAIVEKVEVIFGLKEATERKPRQAPTRTPKATTGVISEVHTSDDTEGFDIDDLDL